MQRMRNKYRLVISNAETYEEIWGMRLSRLNFLVVLGTFFLFVLLLSWLVISFTPIREFVPGYTDSAITQRVVNNALRADSLAREVDLWSSYLDNLRIVLSGGTPENYLLSQDSVLTSKEVHFTRSEEDSLLRVHVEKDLQLSQSPGSGDELLRRTNFNLIPPVYGQISNRYDASGQHYGIDIVASPNATVCSVADGTVVLAYWDYEVGYVIGIQHVNGLLSMYKHNERLFRRVNDRVKSGDAIALMGSTGKLSTGPHLHFELWYQGRSLNPEHYIVF